jgi:hypothetical protein
VVATGVAGIVAVAVAVVALLAKGATMVTGARALLPSTAKAVVCVNAQMINGTATYLSRAPFMPPARFAK